MTPRIVEKFWRNPYTAEVKSYFVVQEPRKKMFGGVGWSTRRRIAALSFDGPVYEEISFDTLKEAEKFCANLSKEIPKDKVHAYSTPHLLKP